MNTNNNTDKKLQQLENQSLPDLSQQGEHWQEMKKMLQPAILPAKPAGTKRIWQWVVAAGIIGVVFFTGYKFLNTSKKEIKKEGTASVAPKPTIETLDTIKDKKTIAYLSPSTPSHNKPVKVITTTVGFLRILDSMTDTSANPLIILPDTAISNTAKPKATLTEFFSQLEKASQQYVIDSKRDTIIKGNEGTSLFIPANTFSENQPVTIILKEFYSYKDIISNKLTTTSNNQQLVSGGMIHVTASVNGKEVNMIPGQRIRWFIPDTTDELKEMKLFTGQIKKDDSRDKRTFNTVSDTILSENGFEGINWVPQYQNFSTSGVITEVRALDLRDFPYRITTGKRNKAFFYMKNDSELSKEELLALLSARNKWYDKIIIRKHKEKEWCTYTLKHEPIDCYTAIGDTIKILPKLAKIYKLPVFDTVISINQASVRRPISEDLKKNFSNLSTLFSVEISSLGWINCDRFYIDARPKIQYFVDLKDKASDYYTILVFDKIKSMMTGVIVDNKIVFSNIPEGETAKVISVGIKDGNPVSAMETVQISRTTFTGLKFEKTTPPAFKEQVSIMDK